MCRYVNRLSTAKEKKTCSFKKHLPPKGVRTAAFSITCCEFVCDSFVAHAGELDLMQVLQSTYFFS